MNPLMTGIQTIATTLASDDSSICSISIDNAVVTNQVVAAIIPIIQSQLMQFP